MPSLEIEIKKLLVSWKGHQSFGARAPELWCPQLYLECYLTNACSFYAGNVLKEPDAPIR